MRTLRGAPSPKGLRRKARGGGRALAERLAANGACERTTLLALARGGVGVGLEVSKRLGLPLDLLLLRRLLVTRGHEEPLCAASVAGARFLDEEVAARAAVDPVLESFVASSLVELEEHARV